MSSSIAPVPYENSTYNSFTPAMSNRPSGSYTWSAQVSPTTDSHQQIMSPTHINHQNGSAANQQPPLSTPTSAHHPHDSVNISPPPTATTNRSGTSSPPRQPPMTPDARDVRRQHSQMRRESKTLVRGRRTNSNPYGTEIPSGPPSAGISSVYGSPQGPPSAGQMPMMGEGANGQIPSPNGYMQPYSPSIPEGSPHYAYQSHSMSGYAMPMGYDFHQPNSPYGARNRGPPQSLPMDPSNMMYNPVPSMMSPGMPSAPHHPHHVPTHAQHPHAHPHNGAPGHIANPDPSVRVVQTRPKPQCWDHGCNGRQFSTFSNLLRHQREKSGQAAKATCPNCGAEFTRTTARNGHLLHEKCKKRNPNAAPNGTGPANGNSAAPSAAAAPSTTGSAVPNAVAPPPAVNSAAPNGAAVQAPGRLPEDSNDRSRLGPSA